MFTPFLPEHRIRTPSGYSQAQVFEPWIGGWTNFGGSVTLTGLPVGWRQVQVRTLNPKGASPPSTNVASTGSAPDAYRGVIIVKNLFAIGDLRTGRWRAPGKTSWSGLPEPQGPVADRQSGQRPDRAP